MWTWWLAYINGFTIDQHCQRCFRGLYGNSGRRVSLSMPLNQPVPLDETSDYRHLYLCGVSHAGYANNFHLAFEYAAGSPDIILPSAGGMRIVVENARRLEIPSLPDGYGGYPRSFTTCRNWQFGVAYYTDRSLPVLPVDESLNYKAAKAKSQSSFRSLIEKARAHKVERIGVDEYAVRSASSNFKHSFTVKHNWKEEQLVRSCNCQYGQFHIGEDCRCSHALAVDLFLESQE